MNSLSQNELKIIEQELSLLEQLANVLDEQDEFRESIIARYDVLIEISEGSIAVKKRAHLKLIKGSK